MGKQITTLLEGLGISGWDKLEPAIFCALKTGTPINLVGDKGTSKTEFCHRMGIALMGKDCRFQKYDTPDATLDQILGFMNLKKMEEGMVDFVKTGTSIWNKNVVLWDEINRVSPMFQGKLLEVVRSGKIHGLETEVKFQFATCNPPRAAANSVGHEVYFLGDAMASRFFYVHVPKTTPELYDAAMRFGNVRKAFDTNDSKAIAECCKDIATFWLEFSHEKPNSEELDLAQKIVRGILKETTSKGIFDMRAAIRCTQMLAELICLNRLHPLGQDLPSYVQSIVQGNIVEFNGVIRHDRSGEAEGIMNTLRINAQALFKNLLSPGTISVLTTAYTLTQRGNFDEMHLQPLISELRKQPTRVVFEQAISGFVKKLTPNDKFRDTNFRAGHKNAIATFLKLADSFEIKTLTLSLFGAPPTVFNVDLNNATAIDTAKELHDNWYAACGLGSAK